MSTDLPQPGTLVRARGREWVVLPESNPYLVRIRPLGGLDEEETVLLAGVEAFESARFPLPGEGDLGDAASARLLREAARLTTRAAAGPFRSFARISVEPRPYQLVPLMMALRLNPVRLLLADDVGIGKTIEAALIARELLDRGEIQRLTVLCPPPLAEQWQNELFEKFHIEAELVLSSTIQRLERNLRIGESVFDRCPFTVVSTDFIKTDRRAEDFVNKCPEFVIVDEAHGCTVAGPGRGRQRRYDLIRRISDDPNRHLVLVTATPHSGNEDSFRSLLGLLRKEFGEIPTNLDREEARNVRQRLARHLVQRRRGDIREYLQVDTEFPKRLEKEESYQLSSEYRKLFEDVWKFAREYVEQGRGEDARRRRVRYWSALALLRCVSSSPRAAAATLRKRAAVSEAEDERIDEVGRRLVLDQTQDDEVEWIDIDPGADAEENPKQTRDRMLEFARRAERLRPEDDEKLLAAVRHVRGLLDQGFRPVVFCRFVSTAEYVADHLRNALPHVDVASVTGDLPPVEREARIGQLVQSDKPYVLVCTDCLSEGINLQRSFDAVVHYDLAWNPTRHEQREGRVDRFGQAKPEVRILTLFGRDNPMDGAILEVLIRKHKKIRSDLGVAVAVPSSSEEIAEALFEAALLRGGAPRGGQLAFEEIIDQLGDTPKKLEKDWQDAAEREKRSRSLFAQHGLRPEEVKRELDRVAKAVGRSADVERFVKDALGLAGVRFDDRNGALSVHLDDAALRHPLVRALGVEKPFVGRFVLPVAKGEVYLGRTSPLVENLAAYVLESSLDPEPGDDGHKPIAKRITMFHTAEVATRTHLLVARFRYHVQTGRGQTPVLAEEIVPLACTGQPEQPAWLDDEEAERLLAVEALDNPAPSAVQQQTNRLLKGLCALREALQEVALRRAGLLKQAHDGVRSALSLAATTQVAPILPADILAVTLLLPKLD